jgi:hypothetical protein
MYCEKYSCIERNIEEYKGECFRLTSTVITNKQPMTVRAIKDLNIGDTIYTLNRDSLELEEDTFIGYLDYNPNQSKEYVQLKDSHNNTILELTKYHLIYAICANNPNYYFALELQVGD